MMQTWIQRWQALSERERRLLLLGGGALLLRRRARRRAMRSSGLSLAPHLLRRQG